MSKGTINKVLIIGNLGANPEIRYTSNGKPVVTLSVATSEVWTSREREEKQERTEWHRVVLFARLAEIAKEYLKKGTKIYVEGSIRTRKWQRKDGENQYTTEIVANEFQILDSRGRNREEDNEKPYKKESSENRDSIEDVFPDITDDNIPF